MRVLKVFIPVVFLFLFSCDELVKCNQGDYSIAGDNLFGFYILDKETKENLLHIRTTDYLYGKIKILDSDLQKVYPTGDHWGYNDGFVIIPFIDNYKDKNVLDQRLKRTFYFYFDETDMDTIDVEFEMKKDDCGKQIMKYFKVAYNDSVYYDAATDYVPEAEFLK